MSSPKVTLFFITYNQRLRALQTLSDVLNQTYPASQLDLIVLVDGSTDGSYDALIEASGAISNRIRVFFGNHDAHYRSAFLWNRCISLADPSTEVFIQVDDVRMRPDFVERHAEWHCQDSDFIVTGAKFEGSSETWELQSCLRHHLAGPGQSATIGVPPTAIWGASLSYPSRLLPQACSQISERPFDEGMNGYGHHEVEFALRMQKAGARTVYDPAVGVFHERHDSVSEEHRGLNRRELVKQGLQGNARYICEKHGLTALPRW